MFLYAMITCDKSEQSDSNQHISDCPVRSVSLTSGLLVVVLTIWLMPPFIHALTGRTMRAYGLAAGPCAAVQAVGSTIAVLLTLSNPACLRLLLYL